MNNAYPEVKPAPERPARRCTDLLRDVAALEGGRLQLGALVAALRHGGFALLLIVFAGPLALPLPAVGIATVMSVPMAFLCLQLLLGRQTVWLPEKLAKRSISGDLIRKVAGWFIPRLEKLEHCFKPRLIMLSGRLGRRFLGLFGLLLVASIALPIPFSNTVPSMGLVIISIGLLERDGVLVLLGMLVGLAGVTLTTLIIFFGVEAVKQGIEALFAL